MIQFTRNPRWSATKKGWPTLLVLFVAISLVLFNSLAAFANNVNDNVFEIGDGDTIDSPSGAPFDWESFFDGSGSGGSIGRRTNPDAAHFQAVNAKSDFGRNDATTFATGSKDILNPGPVGNTAAGWQCSNSNNLGGKFDLLNAYVLNYVGPVTPTGAIHNVLLFGAERDSNNGDANIGFWFLQDGTIACDSSNGTGSFTGNHVNNDLFIVSSFSNGGTASNIIIYRWVGGATGGLEVPGRVISGLQADCHSSVASNIACATVNSSPLTSPHPPWKTHATGSQTLDNNEFFEGMLDLTEASQSLGIPGLDTLCFTNSLVNTRTSTSEGATIMDYVLVPFEACGKIKVVKTIDAETNAAGAQINQQVFRYRTTSPAGTNHPLPAVLDLDGSISTTLTSTFDSNLPPTCANVACLNPGTYTITEDAVSGWNEPSTNPLPVVTCAPSAACSISGRTATITLGARGDVTVFYTNKLRYKVYVVACQQTGLDNNFNAYSSTVTLGDRSASSAPAGNQAAEDLCNGSTPALFTNLLPGTIPGSIFIPAPVPIPPAAPGP